MGGCRRERYVQANGRRCGVPLQGQIFARPSRVVVVRTEQSGPSENWEYDDPYVLPDNVRAIYLFPRVRGVSL